MGQSAQATPAGGVHGFVPALTGFVGRGEAMGEVAGLLEERRLVTVTGPGGVGKTRLAGEVAKPVAGRFADGVWLAELAPVADPAQVAAVVAAAAGVRHQPGVPAAGALALVLARQQLLLVLDNCEHVIGAAAELCAGLLAACDDVRVLATSREPLQVAGEARYRLGPLCLPGPDDPAEGSEAVALFADRARRADARFRLAPWWNLRGRLTGEYPLLGQAAGYAPAGSDGWCAAQLWLGEAAIASADMAAALGHLTAVCDAIGDRGPSRMLADVLNGRSAVWRELGRIPEAVQDSRRALAVARELGYPTGQAQAHRMLGLAAYYASDLPGAVRQARQAGQIPGDIRGGIARACASLLALVLIEAGELGEAERVCAAGLASSREAGDLRNQMRLLGHLADLDTQAGRLSDAAAHLRAVLQIAVRTGAWLDLLDDLDYCGFLCAATGRHAEAITVWAAFAALLRARGHADPPGFAARRRGPLREARRALGPARSRRAEDRGAAMSLSTAAEYALMLTAPGPPPATVTPGADLLSARERELVTLVARGRTNAQIAAELSISVRTVGSHLDRIRDKTGCRRRTDLTRLALAGGLV